MCCTANPCADCSKLYETTTETNKIEFWEFSFQSLREMPAMGPVVKLSVVCCVPAVDLTHRWDNKRATWADIQMTLTQLPSYTTLSCRFALFVRSGDGQAQSEQNDIQNNNLFRSSSFPPFHLIHMAQFYDTNEHRNHIIEWSERKTRTKA